MTDPWDRLRRHRYGPLLAPLAEEASLEVRPMFGLLACYLHGRLKFVLAAKRPPWRGVFAPTERPHQPALRALLPSLGVHPVLGKWLVLAESAPDFEEAAATLVALALADDPRLGVEPKPRRRRRPGGRGTTKRAPAPRGQSAGRRSRSR